MPEEHYCINCNMKMRTVTPVLLDYFQYNNVVPKDANTHT
jgi:hypothetical protein